MASYKQQLGWSEERVKDADRARKPVYTLLALTTAVTTAVVSRLLHSGAPSGFEGFMPMLLGAATGFLGALLAVAFCLVAFVREKKYLWVNLVSMGICLASALWLLN